MFLSKLWLLTLSLTLVVSIRDVTKGCWPHNVIPYKIHTGFSKEQKLFILDQMRKLHQKTCLRWVDMTENNLTVTDFALFLKSSESICFMSGEEYDKGYVAVIKLADTCFERKRTVLHEMLHVLGFKHEQQRSDRDCYVKVDEENVELSGSAKQFEIVPQEKWLESFPYDKQSLMHYARDIRIKAHSERWYDYEPLGTEDAELTYIDLWKILYRFCGAAHYCEAAPLVCEDLDKKEKDCWKPSIKPGSPG